MSLLLINRPPLVSHPPPETLISPRLMELGKPTRFEVGESNLPSEPFFFTLQAADPLSDSFTSFNFVVVSLLYGPVSLATRPTVLRSLDQVFRQTPPPPARTRTISAGQTARVGTLQHLKTFNGNARRETIV